MCVDRSLGALAYGQNHTGGLILNTWCEMSKVSFKYPRHDNDYSFSLSLSPSLSHISFFIYWYCHILLRFIVIIYYSKIFYFEKKILSKFLNLTLWARNWRQGLELACGVNFSNFFCTIWWWDLRLEILHQITYKIYFDQ